MENNFFPSKLSFVLFTWFAIFISATTLTSKNAHVFENLVHTIQNTTIQLANFITQTHLPTAIPGPFKMPTDEKKVIEISKSDLQCMAENIYYEAGNQSYVGKMAVGQVVLNRTKSPNYPGTICGVIYDGANSLKTTVCQFSWLCLEHKPVDKSSVMWQQSLLVAKELLAKKDQIVDITEGATSYHADYVKPGWSKQLRFVTQIDQHLFYRSK